MSCRDGSLASGDIFTVPGPRVSKRVTLLTVMGTMVPLTETRPARSWLISPPRISEPRRVDFTMPDCLPRNSTVPLSPEGSMRPSTRADSRSPAIFVTVYFAAHDEGHAATRG